jgi:hypothetical protein
LVDGCYKYGDEPAGSGTTELESVDQQEIV